MMLYDVLIYAGIGLLTVCLFVSLYYNYKFGVIILKVQDTVESSLDVLDQNYRIMSEILEKPVFFDSIEVRQALDSIAKSRDSILLVANDLVDSISEEKETQQE